MQSSLQLFRLFVSVVIVAAPRYHSHSHYQCCCWCYCCREMSGVGVEEVRVVSGIADVNQRRWQGLRHRMWWLLIGWPV